MADLDLAERPVDDAAEPDAPATDAARQAGGESIGGTILKWAGGLLAALLLLLGVGYVVFQGPIGQRFVADQIAKLEPGSGLRVEVGRIEGNVLTRATLHDVVLSDTQGVFMTIPEAELDWRPLGWLSDRLDIRELIVKRAELIRLPELNEGDPDAPILPDFDIRVGRLVVEDMALAAGIVGAERRALNLTSEVDVTGGRLVLDLNGRFDSGDTLLAKIDSRPDDGVFDIDVDLNAPGGGAVAAMLGLKGDTRLDVKGVGNFDLWRGHLLASRDGQRLGAFRLTNRDGRYGIVGQARPGDYLNGLAADALGQTVSLAAYGTLEESMLDGRATIIGRGIRGHASGALDLADNLARTVQFQARLTDPNLFGADVRLEDARVKGTANGAFRSLSIDHHLTVGRLVSGSTVATGLTQNGRARYDGARWMVPLDLTAGRVQTGNDLLDPRLVDGTLRGELLYTGTQVLIDAADVNFPGASARLSLDGDLRSKVFRITGPVAVNGLQFDKIGLVNAGARIDYRTGAGPWTLKADVDGRIPRVTNETLANLAGPDIRFAGGVTLGGAQSLQFRGVTADAAKLSLTMDGRITDGRTSIAGRGRHVDYGPFTVEGALTDAGPEAVLVFADPLPDAGLRDVRVALTPSVDGFDIETTGDSMLGTFEGSLGLFSPRGGPTRIAVNSLTVANTQVTGALTLGKGGATGELVLANGGLDGTIMLAERGGGQGFDIDLVADNARFGGATPLVIRRGTVDASGLLVDGNSTIEGSGYLQGVSYGGLFIGRLAAEAQLRNGSGTVTAALAGRRGSRFNLQLAANVTPERAAIAAKGNYAGKPITLPRRAVLLRQDDGGFLLEPTQISYGGGIAIASGEFGGDDLALDLRLDDLPLSLVDIAVSNAGLGGTISGNASFSLSQTGLPIGDATVRVAGLTRSGLVLSSRPVDVALVMKLTERELEGRAVINDGTTQNGRFQGRVAGLPPSGKLLDRLQAGDLFGQLRYRGPAQALWRLAAVDAFDLTGPLSVAADITGSLAEPEVRGSLKTDNLRLRSSISGTNIREIKGRGTFRGSRLRIARFTGVGPNGGTVTGSGTVDLSNLGRRGPGIDIRVAAKNARVLNARGLSATITGPLRIVSNGIGGTIAGRLSINRASWRLSNSEDLDAIPRIDTRQINLPLDSAPARTPRGSWRYLIDAVANDRVDVDGMGLDSEWSADILLRGTTSDPRIGGQAQVVRGDYTFAGTRFELTRGRIDFDERVPIDPRLDIRAETQQNNLDVTVAVTGNSQRPEISFTSEPPLAEEELLAQLLFGGSITELSATDALQLGAAVASLNGGGGMDPINRLRSAIGLDRLRIVAADPALGRGTGVALGKNFGRRFYVEIITDGRGYSATETEFRVTSWLSILATISTIGRESIGAEVSKDY
ncbi:hypothetical protein HME9302_00508 [Alteripontixanthobacter maritimus]|uniref:Translocation and assembly module TamB C-terminal domain-containing protein n=1 Tax=Alteripontixanthobacter maritimus TaxID=2161824 RepID=A0A369Q355_9SPHN|nr:translocation/assembly module TamB domain-containing protein [Alteripontixanthobacter maritimus]RDC59321.1 hypothetical protein HME9302_00508 [Alteripontixanthobacter maritimus]